MTGRLLGKNSSLNVREQNSDKNGSRAPETKQNSATLLGRQIRCSSLALLKISNPSETIKCQIRCWNDPSENGEVAQYTAINNLGKIRKPRTDFSLYHTRNETFAAHWGEICQPAGTWREPIKLIKKLNSYIQRENTSKVNSEWEFDLKAIMWSVRKLQRIFFHLET